MFVVTFSMDKSYYSMRFLILTSIMLSFAHITQAQNAPVLDSIAIDEDSSILLCYGNFGTNSQATVHIADTTLGVLSQTDTLIRAVMPMSGNGAAGPVSVEIGGLLSSSKLITYLHFSIYCSWGASTGDDGDINGQYTDSVNLRADLSRFSNTNDSLRIIPSRISRYSHSASGRNGSQGFIYDGPTYDSTGICYWLYTIYSDKQAGTIQIEHPIFYACGYPANPISLDALYAIGAYKPNETSDTIAEFTCPNGPPYFFPSKSAGWAQTAPTEFPPLANGIVSSDSEDSNFTAALVTQEGHLLLELSSSYSSAQIDVFDILGHKITSMNQSLNTGENFVSLSNLIGTPGEYIARIRSGNEVRSLKFINSQ